MNEIVTAITDVMLTALCSFFAWRLWAGPAERKDLRLSFVGLYVATGLAALLGAMIHGFMPDRAHQLFPILWISTLASIGVAAYNMWNVNFQIALGQRLLPAGRWISRIFLLSYLFAILFVSPNFVMAITAYVPPAVVLALLLALRGFRTRERFVLIGFLGLILTFTAAYVQRARIGLDDQYFDHNAFYHLIQGFGLWYVYLFARHVVRWKS